MRISVVVPTYNRKAIVTRTLETLFAQDCPRESMAILVVVDGSTDGSAESLRALHAPCSFRVLEQENRGLAGARNSGLRAATGDVVLFLDDDMRCATGLVAAHLEAHRRQQGIACFGALFLSEDSPRSLAAECFKHEIGAAHLRTRAPGDSALLSEDCVFSNASLLRETLVSLGGFDESFRMREDLEFGERLFATGVRPVYLPEAVAHQYYEKTAADVIREAEAFAAYDLMLVQKHPQMSIVGSIPAILAEKGFKPQFREWAARHLAFVDALLRPVCAVGDRFHGVAALRELGVRALKFLRRVHWLHTVRRLQAQPPRASQ